MWRLTAPLTLGSPRRERDGGDSHGPERRAPDPRPFHARIVPDPAVESGLSINGSLVLTGSLLRFLPGAALVSGMHDLILPGAALVSGMHDLISGAFMSGIARMAEVFLIGAAIAGAASLVLSFGERLDVDLRISISGHVGWPAVVLAAAGAIAVTFYAIRVGVPLANLAATAALGAISVVIARGLTPLSADLSRNARTLFAALAIGVLARLFSKRSRAPSVIWAVPAILPLLPAPATLLPLLAETQRAQRRCRVRHSDGLRDRRGCRNGRHPGGHVSAVQGRSRNAGPERRVRRVLHGT
jgi:uncharacterized membrane protein YjjB (DUF3815 family)